MTDDKSGDPPSTTNKPLSDMSLEELQQLKRLAKRSSVDEILARLRAGDPDPENQIMYNHPAIREFLQAVHDVPGFPVPGMPPVSFRMLIQDWDEREERERNRPRLQADNPTKTGLRIAGDRRTSGYILTFLAIVSALVFVALLSAVVTAHISAGVKIDRITPRERRDAAE